jgi:hypothetical protein
LIYSRVYKDGYEQGSKKEWIVEALNDYSVFFRAPVVPWHGGGSRVNVLLMLHLQAKLQKLFGAENVCEPRKQKYVTPLSPGQHGLAQAKALAV